MSDIKSSPDEWDYLQLVLIFDKPVNVLFAHLYFWFYGKFNVVFIPKKVVSNSWIKMYSKG